MQPKPHSKFAKFDQLSVLLHWIIALLMIVLFASGLWMVELDYYHTWYYKAPWWHKSLGVVAFILLLSRWLWSVIRVSPEPLASIPPWQQVVAKFVHGLLNVFVVFLAVSGYLIVTLKGDGLSVFDWFIIPSALNNRDWVDSAGVLHKWLAYLLIGLALCHALAAVKHHVVDKDATLLRMLNCKKGEHQ